MKVLVLGMGNPLLSDDGVGLVVAERLKGKLPGVDVWSETMIGLGLIHQVLGYDKIFVIDAMTTGDLAPGEIKIIHREDKLGTRHLFSSHGMNFYELMELGVYLGYAMPEIGALYGIAINREVYFGESLSGELMEKISYLTETIGADISCRIGLS